MAAKVKYYPTFHIPCRASLGNANAEPQAVVRTAICLAGKILENSRVPKSITDDRFVVGLFGIPGSGKTTTSLCLLRFLENAVPDVNPRLLSQDGYHYTRAKLDTFEDKDHAHARRGAPFTFDAEALADALLDFKGSPEKTLLLPKFDHSAKDPEPNSVICKPATRLLLLEGNYLGLNGPWDKVRASIDMLVFLQVPIDTAMRRVERRHVSQMGLTVSEARTRIDTNDRLNAELVIASKASADLTLSVEP